MCGIAGIVDFGAEFPPAGILREMLSLIHHRGPDALGIHLGKFAGLGSTRLRIIDLQAGDQPIHNEDRSVWVTYNGEIFNYPELRADLEAQGHQFYTQSDTEVLVHLYEEYGPDLLGRLNGQFAFALWDQKKETLLLGRDRLGIRPLFYFRTPDRIAFSSEIKGIFADPSIPRSLNLQTIADIFTCWAPLDSATPFEGIFQIPPGHFALFCRQGFHMHRYWAVDFTPEEGRPRSWEDWAEGLKELIYDAVRIRLRSDVPVGTYLSGGLDSTLITYMVRRFFNADLCTFSVRFTDGRFDEAAFQEKAIQDLKTNHRSICCAEEDIGQVFPQVIWHTETPILRTSPAPLFQLSQLVRENGYKVVLTGEGSDEIFAGYDIFKEDKIRRFWGRNPRSGIRPRLLHKLYPDIFGPPDSRTQKFLEGFFRNGLSLVDSPAYSHWIRWKNTSQVQAMFSPELRERISQGQGFMERFLSGLPKDFMSWDPLSRAQYTEMSIFLSNFLLSSQGDRMAMAHSVEGRFPFLDYRVVERACRLPAHYRMKGLQEKFILRKIAAELLPAEIARRPKKPYRAPISRCFLGSHRPEYVEELLSEKAIREKGYFDPLKVSHLVNKCRASEGLLLSERENMALVGILSTQLLDQLFIRNFQQNAPRETTVPLFVQ